MRRVACAAVLAICLGACASGSDRQDESAGSNPDRQGDPSGASGGSDRPGGLTGFVIDLIDRHTTDDALPVAYERFASLPDPDGDANNPGAYASMF
jgi:hypothetical protein